MRRATRHRIPDAEIARLMREVAELLALERANAFRVRAYSSAARAIRHPAVDICAHPSGRLIGQRRGADFGGVDQARRGWVARQDVVNTRSLASLVKLLHRGRR
ncbi:MAG: hypothetical protein ACHQQR_01935 [Gemmatimonadales bacterium]